MLRKTIFYIFFFIFLSHESLLIAHLIYFFFLFCVNFLGYGTIAPKTTLGRVVTLAYALLGIPLTLIYLSSSGGVLAKVARGVFSR
jgi:hypothetical protein